MEPGEERMATILSPRMVLYPSTELFFRAEHGVMERRPNGPQPHVPLPQDRFFFLIATSTLSLTDALEHHERAEAKALLHGPLHHPAVGADGHKGLASLHTFVDPLDLYQFRLVVACVRYDWSSSGQNIPKPYSRRS